MSVQGGKEGEKGKVIGGEGGGEINWKRRGGEVENMR